jgi:hypothetical protein
MFPKLIRNATMEDVKRDNPKLLEEITAQLTNDLNATLQVTHMAKITELETQLAVLNSEKTILMAGINSKQGVLAQSLIAEGKSESDALCAITSASKSLNDFIGSAPAAAGSGSAADAQTIDTQAKAIEAVLATNPSLNRAGAVRQARREYTHLFVNPILTNYKGKRN